MNSSGSGRESPTDDATRNPHYSEWHEETLQEGEERLRFLVQHAPDITTILDAEGTIRYVNPALEKVLGYRPEDLVERSAFDYVHPEDVEEVSRAFARLLDSPGINPPLEFRVRHVDGSWRYIELINNNMLDDPVIRGVLTYARDVTQRKQTEEKLRFQTQLLDAVGQAVIATDTQGNVVYWNRFAEDLYGCR